MISSLTVKHTQKTRPHTVISLEASQQLFLTDNDPNELQHKAGRGQIYSLWFSQGHSSLLSHLVSKQQAVAFLNSSL